MISFLAITPHGEEVIAPKDMLSKHLHTSMLKLVKLANSADIDVFVVITPHNIRIADHLGIITTAYTKGKLGNRKREYACDRVLANTIYNTAKSQNLPVVAINFGALEGSASCITLDWGSFIPLYFLNRSKKVVLITPARAIKNQELVRFGMVLGQVCEDYNKNVALVISADHAHTHQRTGPYGYSKYAKIYDLNVVKALKSNTILSLKHMDTHIIDSAKPDSFWQLLILAGVLKIKKFKVREIDYQVPSYFGMMVVSFTPPDTRKS